MKEGDFVKLVSFNGIINSGDNSDEKENYWKLIGCKGKIISNKDGYFKKNFFEKERFLVRFEDDIKSKNLYCHNDVENALWILKNDLEIL